MAVNGLQSSREGGGLPGGVEELTVDEDQAQLFADFDVDRGETRQFIDLGEDRTGRCLECREMGLDLRESGAIAEGLFDCLALQLGQQSLASLDLGRQMAVGSSEIQGRSIGPGGGHIIYFHNLSPDANMTKLIDMMIKFNQIPSHYTSNPSQIERFSSTYPPRGILIGEDFNNLFNLSCIF
jgi:hypothetical protein